MIIMWKLCAVALLFQVLQVSSTTNPAATTISPRTATPMTITTTTGPTTTAPTTTAPTTTAPTTTDPTTTSAPTIMASTTTTTTMVPTTTTTTAPTTPMVPTSSNLTLQAEPDMIYNGITKFLTVNCTFNPGTLADYTTLITLILSKSQSGTSVFTEVATITAFSNDKINEVNTNGAKVTGQHEAKGDSYISMEWRYPPYDVDGIYKCEAFGTDKTGHLKVLSSLKTITNQKVDYDMILLALAKMDNTLDDLTQWKDNVEGKIAASHSALTEIAQDYQNHAYSLSRPVLKNAAVTNSLCQFYGGYVVEPSDQAELNFTSELVRKGTHTVKEPVALGAKEGQNKGTWTFVNSGVRMTYFNWGSGQPNGSFVNNCLFLQKKGKDSVGMFDNECIGLNFARFICES